MEKETTNKKLKSNLSENNDNNKIIVLPLIIQKQILRLLYEEYDNMDSFEILKEFKNKIINYSIVDSNWFKNSQKLFSNFIPHIYFDKNNNKNYSNFKYNKNLLYRINNNNNNNNSNNNKYKLVHNDLIKTIIIDYFEINNRSIDYMNSLKSLETVNVRCLHYYEYSFTNSIWVLTYLNKLDNKDVIINFKLYLGCCDPYEPTNLELIDREEFKFKTNKFKVSYDIEYETTYGFVYEMIKELNPKYLKIKPLRCVSDSGESHLLQYHSISKLNQNYESVEIINDFIPLYALYRFLQSPNLHTLKFDLQFHFLSSIYDNNQINNNRNNNNNNNCNSNSNRVSGDKNKTELDFNKMDNFKFIDFGYTGDYNEQRIRFKVHDDIDNGINEDNQIYCSYSRQEDSCIEIPPYSMSLWKQCLKLLSTNSTITNLTIYHNCGGPCYSECGWKENSLFNENFLNDFMNSLANNKTIKNLTLGFGRCNIGNKSIVSMLDQNTTLESIYIIIPFSGLSEEISKLTKNTKCKITTEQINN
ncbi:hypothetical protein ACTFIY_009876 [Dictyostelium cf. discoideum]